MTSPSTVIEHPTHPVTPFPLRVWTCSRSHSSLCRFMGICIGAGHRVRTWPARGNPEPVILHLDSIEGDDRGEGYKAMNLVARFHPWWPLSPMRSHTQIVTALGRYSPSCAARVGPFGHRRGWGDATQSLGEVPRGTNSRFIGERKEWRECPKRCLFCPNCTSCRIACYLDLPDCSLLTVRRCKCQRCPSSMCPGKTTTTTAACLCFARWSSSAMRTSRVSSQRHQRPQRR